MRQLDVRYVGQSFELTIPAGDDLDERFHREHDRTYGFSAPGEPVECVSVRLTSIGRIAKPPPRTVAAGSMPGPKERRPVYFAEAAGYVDCPIYDRYALPAGAANVGPCGRGGVRLDHRRPPGFALRVDELGNLIVEREGA